MKTKMKDLIHKENPTRFNNISKFIIPYLYEAQQVSGDTRPIIRSLKLHWQPLVFYTWKVVGRVVGGRCQAHTTRPTTFHVWKPRGCQCSFKLLMMSSVSPETCWASYKYGIINFDILLHLVGFFFMNCAMMHGSTNIKFMKDLSSRTVSLNRIKVHGRLFINNLIFQLSVTYGKKFNIYQLLNTDLQ
jgi:hypothetical protein